MVISTELVAEVGRWRVKKLFSDGEFTHYVLNVPMDKGHATNPFDEVRASGGLLSLMRNGETSVTFTGVIGGSNTYQERSDMPREIFEVLQDIGPY